MVVDGTRPGMKDPMVAQRAAEYSMPSINAPLPPEIEFGAWRKILPNERTDALSHITLINDVLCVPARLYRVPETPEKRTTPTLTTAHEIDNSPALRGKVVKKTTLNRILANPDERTAALIAAAVTIAESQPTAANTIFGQVESILRAYESHPPKKERRKVREEAKKVLKGEITIFEQK